MSFNLGLTKILTPNFLKFSDPHLFCKAKIFLKHLSSSLFYFNNCSTGTTQIHPLYHQYTDSLSQLI
ncbi:hypothetical protein BpHYR1_041212 [Brachionus plicatilis]|uniref:Uncharacterized protein n=1 Tax=Brachionus plicatilis TaxID=10195 RepID=A0A3M7PQR1_BRAPC|nr:hypothetical protein BpHYR1_041212 [Brachionus plicatilis]